jgi:putative transposase
MLVQRRQRVVPTGVNGVWALDFVADQLAHGSRFRALTIVDVFTSEALAIEVGKRLGAEHVVASLNRLVAQLQAPRYLFVDNGSEFSGRLLDLWAYHHKVQLDFSRPGKPTDNSFVETFNGSLRDECLRKLPRNVDSVEVELSGTMIREGGSNEAIAVYGAADCGGAQAG